MVLISALLGLVIALLFDRAFLGRGVVRTLLITPFLITPVAAALVWKTTILDPDQRHPQLGAVAGRHRPGGLDRSSSR